MGPDLRPAGLQDVRRARLAGGHAHGSVRSRRSEHGLGNDDIAAMRSVSWYRQSLPRGPRSHFHPRRPGHGQPVARNPAEERKMTPTTEELMNTVQGFGVDNGEAQQAPDMALK